MQGCEDSVPFVPEYYLKLTYSQGESLKEFIEDHLLKEIRENPEVDCMEWLADMCEIWRELEGWQK